MWYEDSDIAVTDDVKVQQSEARKAIRTTFMTDSLQPSFDYAAYAHYMCAMHSSEASVNMRLHVNACLGVREEGYDIEDDKMPPLPPIFNDAKLVPILKACAVTNKLEPGSLLKDAVDFLNDGGLGEAVAAVRQEKQAAAQAALDKLREESEKEAEGKKGKKGAKGDMPDLPETAEAEDPLLEEVLARDECEAVARVLARYVHLDLASIEAEPTASIVAESTVAE